MILPIIWPQVLPQAELPVLFTALSYRTQISLAPPSMCNRCVPGERKDPGARRLLQAVTFQAAICCICTAAHCMPLQWTESDLL